MRRCLFVLTAALTLALATVAQGATIRVQSTTDTVDAGLVGSADPDGRFTTCGTQPGSNPPVEQSFCLLGEYAKKFPDDRVKYVGVGTGQALDNAKAGLADIVITHAASLEARFVADGFALGNAGRQIFYSDYIIVGPKSDPAGVKAAASNDAVRAYELIAAAGEANPATVRFRSRANNSGTNVQEQIIWGLTQTVTKQQATAASNPGNDPLRSEPGTGGSYPAWYLRNPQGQAANVLATQQCVAAGNGCYTMVDRGTFDRVVNAGTANDLQIVSEKNAANARGGPDLLINPFSAYVLNPDKFPDGSKPDPVAAQRFLDFIVSRDFQQGLSAFPNALNPAFLPDAFQKVTLDPPLTPAVVAGSTLTVAGNISNQLPGGLPVKVMPLRLQSSTDDGTTWGDVATGTTNDTGGFSLTTAPTRTARYRLALPQFTATGYSDYTANNQVIGDVSVTPATGVTPTPTPTPTPNVDTRAPRVSGVKLTRKKLAFDVDEAAEVRVVIERRRKKGGFKKVQAITISAGKAGRVRGSHKRLDAGRYRLRIRAEDVAGNTRTTKPVVRRR